MIKLGELSNSTLEDVCLSITDCHHSSPKYIDKGYAVIRTFNLKSGRFIWDKLSYTSFETFQNRISRAIPKPGDIVLTREAPIGEVCMIPLELKEVCLGQRTVLIKVDEDKIDKHYLLYSLISDYVQTYIRNNTGSGSTVSNLPIPTIKSLLIPRYSKTQEKYIGHILNSIDCKIEINNRINKELEFIAKLIYDYWFVQFDFPDEKGRPYKSSGGKMVYNEKLKREIPEGWVVKKLGVLGNFKNGVNYDPSKPGEIACPIINVRNISASSYFLRNEDLDIIYLRESDVKKYSVHKGSIIIARSGIPGATRLIADYEENTLYCGFAIHYELENLTYKLPIFFFLKSIEQIIKNGSGGTILKNVNQATLNDLSIVLPTNDYVIKEFIHLIEPMFDRINLIQKENSNLAKLRDWLLPMLMNGQVKVLQAN